MKKIISTFITWFLAAFLLLSTISSAYPQTSPSPEATPSSSGVPVVFEDKILFFIQNPLGARSPEQRSQRANQMIGEFARDFTLSLDDLQVTSLDEEGIPLSKIIAGSKIIINISEQDAISAGKTRGELANEYRQKISSAVEQYREATSPNYLLIGTIYSIILTFFLLFLLLVVNRFFANIYRSLDVWSGEHIHEVRLGNYQLIRAKEIHTLLILVIRFFQTGIILMLLGVYLIFVFKQFPWTRDFGEIFWGNLVTILEKGWQLFILYLPNLITIVLVITLVYYLQTLARSFFNELNQGEISLPGFYPEWAWPTYRLVTFLMIALAAVVVFPLLPGFQSPAFQGISVFLGIIFSLGSTAVISNIVSGTVLIYTRSFKIGDYIKINDTYGKVIETTLLVTRILTIYNDVVSIPNSALVNSSIKNLNFAAKELNMPLKMKTSVCLGYEVPWRQVYQTLIEAALKTEGVAPSPPPFVLQESLAETHVVYAVNVYVASDYLQTQKYQQLEELLSNLHENIQDCCAEAGIVIFAPSYEANPNTYGPAANKS